MANFNNNYNQNLNPMYSNNAWGNGGTNIPGYSTNYNTTGVYGQPNFQNTAGSITVIPVQSKEAANSYPVAAGATVLLMDYDHRLFWLKTNNNGVSISMVEHKFVSENDTSNNDSNKDYVSRKEFDELKKMLEDLTKP